MKIIAALHEALLLTEGEPFTINLIVSLVCDILADAGVVGDASYNYIATSIAKMRACGEVVQVGKEGKAALLVLTAKYAWRQRPGMVTITKEEYNNLLDQGVTITHLQGRIRELMCPDPPAKPRLQLVGGVVRTC
jgi:hypothetical protein